jgi:hypothetical protein
MRFFSSWVLGLALTSRQWSTKPTKVSERVRRRKLWDESAKIRDLGFHRFQSSHVR